VGICGVSLILQNLLHMLVIIRLVEYYLIMQLLFYKLVNQMLEITATLFIRNI
jgi:hypothetical protein